MLDNIMLTFFTRVNLSDFTLNYDEYNLEFYLYYENYGKFMCKQYIYDYDYFERVPFDDIEFENFFYGDDIEIQKHFYKDSSRLKYVDIIMKKLELTVRFTDDDEFYIYSTEQMKLFDMFTNLLNLSNKSVWQNGITSFYAKDNHKYLHIDLFVKRWYAYNGRKELTHEEIRQLLKLAFVQEPIIKVYKVKNRKTKFNKITVDLPDVRLILLPDGTLSVQLDNSDVLEGQAVIEDYINVKE